LLHVKAILLESKRIFIFERSVNECICHGIPDLRPLKEGDIVNVDISVYYQGMHGTGSFILFVKFCYMVFLYTGDLNETFLCGQVDEEAKHLVRGAYECMMKAIAFVSSVSCYH
jgi:methionyl aminopeptidase